MDLGLEIEDIVKPGRQPALVEVELARHLTPEDFTALATIPRGTEPPELRKLSERHHTAARLLALGLTNGEVAIHIGMSEARLSSLKSSPAFTELVSLYSEKKDAEFAEFAGRLAGLGKDAIVEIQERLEKDPEAFSNGQLLDLVKAMADRTGFGPSSKVETNINLTLSEKLERARERAKRAMLDDIVDAEVVDDTPRIQNLG